MDKKQALEILVQHREALRARGVRRAALFGSVARGEAGPDSDIDIMVELDPDVRMGIFEYVGLREYISTLFDGRADVVNREGLKPHVRGPATSDAVYAF